MLVYRLTKAKYSSDLSGKGAAKHGGRWNKKGTAAIYTGESIEIVLLEKIVHIPAMILPRLQLITIQIPDYSIREIQIKSLPSKWRNYPAPHKLSEIGEKWTQSKKTLALKVPSSFVPTASNIILNPSHDLIDEAEVKNIADFKIGPRLIK